MFAGAVGAQRAEENCGVGGCAALDDRDGRADCLGDEGGTVVEGQLEGPRRPLRRGNGVAGAQLVVGEKHGGRGVRRVIPCFVVEGVGLPQQLDRSFAVGHLHNGVA